MWEESDVQLVLVEWLKPHEEIKVKARDKLLDMTKRWGGYTKPLLVDINTEQYWMDTIDIRLQDY